MESLAFIASQYDQKCRSPKIPWFAKLYRIPPPLGQKVKPLWGRRRDATVRICPQATKILQRSHGATKTIAWNRFLFTRMPSLITMEVLREAPKSHTFIPLSEHQSATPASFYAGPTVLHYHSSRCKVLILEQDLSQSPALSALVREAQPGPTTAEPVTNGDGSYAEDGDAEPQRVLDDVDVWVTSEYAATPTSIVKLGG